MARRPVIGMYAGSFDPLTLGHLDVIERATKILDKLVIAIGVHSGKSSFFTVEEKLGDLQEACRHFNNVEIVSFQGLAVDFASANGITTLVRGLRTEADFTYEMQMAMMNRVLKPDLQTIFIPSRQDLGHISSSLVKEVARLGGDVSPLVPPNVLQSLKKKLE